MKKTIAMLGLAAAALTVPALAQEPGPFYLGAQLGQSKFKLDCGAGQTCDDKDGSVRLFGGYKFHRNFAGEIGWADLGKAQFTDPLASAQIKTTAWDVSALGMFPVMPQASLFGRLGLYYSTTRFSGDATGEKSATGITFGLGGQWDFTRNIGARLEWQRYNKVKATCDGCGGDSDANVDNLSIGIVYRFD